MIPTNVCIVQDKTQRGKVAAGAISSLVTALTLWLSIKFLDCPIEALPYIRYAIGFCVLLFIAKMIFVAAMLVLIGLCTLVEKS